MKNLDDMIIKMEQIDSLMYALEGALLNTDEEADCDTDKKQVHNLFYLLWEQFQQLQKDADELNGHIEVCNAIYAINRIEELKRELAEVKSGK